MARKSPSSAGDPRDRVIDAFMELLERQPWRDVRFAHIAEVSGVSLADLRGLYPDRVAILTDFGRRIDQTVLAKGPAEGDSVRDRLFDVMMRRFDALRPYRGALRRLAGSACRDPGLAVLLMRNLVRSQSWLFAAADVKSTGPEGAIAVRGAALVFTETARVWLDDDDVDAAATMAALDAALRRGDRMMSAVNRFARVLRPPGRRDGGEPAEAA